MNKKGKSIFIVLLLLNIAVIAIVSYIWIKSDLLVRASKKSAPINTLNVFTLKELSKFNGTNPKLPIYLALDGYIYDISKGREFYQIGGPYHDLAGKDSSKDLHLVGGEIIKRKYPIVGRLEVK